MTEARQTSLTDRLSGFFLKPPEQGSAETAQEPPGSRRGPAGPIRASEDGHPSPGEQVAVVGLSPGCGATTVSLALAAGLARRSPANVAVLASCEPPDVTSFGKSLRKHRAAAMLQAELASRGMADRAHASPLGPVCRARVPYSAAGDLVADPFVAALVALVRGRAALVWDVGAAAVDLLRPALHVADITAVVAGNRSDPELVRLACEHLAGEAATPLVIMNGGDREAEPDSAAAHLPCSRLAVWRLRAGRAPHGAFAQAVACLVDRCAAVPAGG